MNYLEILLVEDSPSDVRLMREAIREAGVPIALQVVRDGLEALRHLARVERGELPCPDLVLLDWHLPLKNGRDVLSAIRQSPALHNIPVLVLTSSAQDEDIRDAYTLNANSYITKPGDLASYLRMVRAIDSFWGATATLAPRPRMYAAPRAQVRTMRAS